MYCQYSKGSIAYTVWRLINSRTAHATEKEPITNVMSPINKACRGGRLCIIIQE